MTFANKPGVSTNVHATIGPNSARNQLVDVDVSQLLAGKAGQLVTVAVDSISADGIDFYSRENASGRPKLIMDVATGPTSPASPTPTTNPQGSDINHDSHVDIFDLGILAAHYGETITSSSAAIVKACDLNSNGRVDVFDVGLMMRDYGT